MDVDTGDGNAEAEDDAVADAATLEAPPLADFDAVLSAPAMPDVVLASVVVAGVELGVVYVSATNVVAPD